MTVSVPTDDFTLLLAAAKLTAYPRPDEDQILSGLYLYTTTADTADGPTTVLVGVGFDGASVGQFAVPCDGTLLSPILMDAHDQSWLTSMCKVTRSAAKKADKEAPHTVSLTINRSRDSLEVQTLTNGLSEPHDRNTNLSLLDASEYPASEADAKLATSGITAAPTDLNSLVKVMGKATLTLKQKAATTLKEEIKEFPSKVNGGPTVLTCGLRWRAVVSTAPYEGDTDGAPDVDPITVPDGTPPGPSVHTAATEALPDDDLFDDDADSGE